VIELCEKLFRGFFPKLGFFAGFSLYIILIAVRNDESAIGGAGRKQRLVLRGKNPLVQSKLKICEKTT
jgi:hypothetical protein